MTCLGKLGKRIHGVEVKGTISQVQERLRAMDIQEIIVAIPSAGENRRHEILQKLSGLERIKNFCFAQYTGHDPPKADALSTA